MSSATNENGNSKILVVDDEPTMCSMLKAALSNRYEVTVCLTGEEAIKAMDEEEFDVVVTDLMLSDAKDGMTGIDILAHAKNRDEFIEVLMITGYASLESAAAAINGGVGSYMLKPFPITELRARVDKMVATREFHKKSLQLISRPELVDPAIKGHVDDLTTLYHFTRKLMLTLEISEVVKITLEEAINNIGAEFSSIEIDLLDYREIYSMASVSLAPKEMLEEVFVNNWQAAFISIDKKSFDDGSVAHHTYKGRNGKFCPLPEYKCFNFPLTVTGKVIGSLSVWVAPQRELEPRHDQYLNIITSIVSPVIEHVYADLQARFQAKTDGLTGIANHRHFYEALEREIARSNRKKNTFALLLADIDNFKKVNDTYGHQVGDAVIIALTKHLKANIRTGDVVARYGGEEFCVVLPETDLDGALVLAERIRASIADNPYIDAKNNVSYTASFGLAMYDGSSPMAKDVLIGIADKALYESKSTGKNKVTIGQR